MIQEIISFLAGLDKSPKKMERKKNINFFVEPNVQEK